MRYRHGGKSEQRRAAIHRRADALTLKKNGQWRGAMYLLGYAVECTLKVRLMEMYRARNLEELQNVLRNRLGSDVDLKTHSIEYLFRLTGALARLQRHGDQPHWSAYREANRWTVDWRYDPTSGSEAECERFFDRVERFLSFLSTSV